jgi:hypothetical protein
MKNPNQTPTYKRPIRAVAAASALVLAASGIGVSKASASTRPNMVVTASVPKHMTTLENLTGIIAALDQGEQAKVTARDIAIPGPINEAEGQPLVFKSDGQTYLAYTQEVEPNFNQKSPEDVAGDMAIVEEPSTDARVPLESAHLDHAAILVDDKDMPVGYSTGGDISGK